MLILEDQALSTLFPGFKNMRLSSTSSKSSGTYSLRLLATMAQSITIRIGTALSLCFWRTAFVQLRTPKGWRSANLAYLWLSRRCCRPSLRPLVTRASKTSTQTSPRIKNSLKTVAPGSTWSTLNSCQQASSFSWLLFFTTAKRSQTRQRRISHLLLIKSRLFQRTVLHSCGISYQKSTILPMPSNCLMSPSNRTRRR